MQELEIPQILAAVSELQKTEAAAIPLTYIICQKRHMTRLFPAEKGAGDRNGNVLPGAPLTDLQKASTQKIFNQALLSFKPLTYICPSTCLQEQREYSLSSAITAEVCCRAWILLQGQ